MVTRRVNKASYRPLVAPLKLAGALNDLMVEFKVVY